MGIPRLLTFCCLATALTYITEAQETNAVDELQELFGKLSSASAADVKGAKRRLSQRSPLLGVHAEEAAKRVKGFLSTTGKADLSGEIARNSVSELGGYVATLASKGFNVLEEAVLEEVRSLLHVGWEYSCTGGLYSSHIWGSRCAARAVPPWPLR